MQEPEQGYIRVSSYYGTLRNSIAIYSGGSKFEVKDLELAASAVLVFSDISFAM